MTNYYYYKQCYQDITTLHTIWIIIYKLLD